jgi:hypothetical protein
MRRLRFLQGLITVNRRTKMLNQLIQYAQGMNLQPDALTWVTTHLKAHLEKHPTTPQTEVEHILDYLASDKRPARLSKMSYAQAKANTDKWNKTLIKKGNNIEEKPEDTKLIHDFKDGFKIVQLIGENAYKREGFLMRHCCLAYFGKGKKVYSLRDKNNEPHCTMEIS